MSSLQRKPERELDLTTTREALLRFQPASNWVSLSRDPTPRMTVGFGFDVGRAEAPEMLRKVGLDPAAVRSGRSPISDAQMNELLDHAIRAAADWAEQRVPGFAEMPEERQWALLELIVWLGPFNAEGVFGELGQLAPGLTNDPLEPSAWFDRGRAEQPRSTPEDPSERRAALRYETTFESFGVVAQLVSDDPDLHVAAEAMLPPGWRAVDARPSVCFGILSDGLITVDGARADRSPHRQALPLKLASVVRHYIATEAPELTFVHAGVVDVGGCGIVIPGRSYTGKSMLVAELVRLEATYVSDEYAVVDQSGLVRPFAKPLSIRTGRGDPLGELVDVPEELVAKHPVRAGLIVVTAYSPGAQWRPSVRSKGEGALALLQNTVSARRRPSPALSVASRLAGDAVTLAGRRGDASDAARALFEAALLRGANWNTVWP
jgi:hypothetical protein